MIFKVYEDDGCPVLELDDEGIDYLAEGLEVLRAQDPGADLQQMTFVKSDGEPSGTGWFTLRRA